MKALRILIIVIAIVFIVVFGRQTLTKISWLVGMPRMALALTDDPVIEGASLYELGRFDEADLVFEEIGRNTTYNRGMTLAVTGKYKLALAYFDAVLFTNRWDSDAQFNRDYINQFVPPVIGKGDGMGRIDAMFLEAGIDAKPFDKDHPLMPVLTERRREVRKPLDVRSIQADQVWLDTLSDAPGEFLANRLAAEHLRREEAGDLHRPSMSPW